MMRLVATLAFAAVASASIDDATSLIQIQKSLKNGAERQDPMPAAAQGLLLEMGEVFELEETGNTLPPGCIDVGCFGNGPDCGASDYTCTSLGFTTTGFYKSCSLADTCATGWKVRCAKCPVTPAPTPPPGQTPAPPVLVTAPPPPATAYWQAPAAVAPSPAVTAPPATAPVLPAQIGFRPEDTWINVSQDIYTINFTQAGGWGGTCLCPDGIEYGVGDAFDYCSTFSTGTALNCNGGIIVGSCKQYSSPVTAIGGWSGGTVICNHPETETPLNLLIKALNNASRTHKQVESNVTLFRQKEKRATNNARQHRRNAVSYSKKVALSNVTIFKATKAMADAYFAQKSASDAAQTALAHRKNYDAQTRYYQKELVDKKQAIKDVEAAIAIAEAAVNKAQSDVGIAKKAQDSYDRLLVAENKRDVAYAKSQVKEAKHAAVKSGMEGAYIDSSESRNTTNVEPYGGGKLFHWRR